MSGGCNNVVNEYPWGRTPRVLSFSTINEFQEFFSTLQESTRRISSEHHFDSLTSLIDLHNRFRSTSNVKLEEVWRNIPVEECAEMKEMTCVGLALTLKGFIVQKNPEWEDSIALGITNEWTSSEKVTEAFWTSTTPPSFPLQCREHSLLFIRVSLGHGRKVVVFLDPGRCLGTPIVVTEDGLPPQSPTMVFKRYNKTREHTVSWGGPEYMRWIIASRKEDSYYETYLRVYVGRHFNAGSYLDWHNLIFPYRAMMFMSPCNGLEICLRVVVGETCDHVLVMIVDEETKTMNQFPVTFERQDGKWDDSQSAAMKRFSDRYGEEKLTKIMCILEKVMMDKDFATQVLSLWDKVKQETEDSLRIFAQRG